MEQERQYLTFHEVCDLCYKHNEENNITYQYGDPHPLKCFVVIKQMPYWQKQYTEAERTYTFRSDNKRFIARMCGNSIFADCVGDPHDKGVRLDWYLNDWEIEKCWVEEDK